MKKYKVRFRCFGFNDSIFIEAKDEEAARDKADKELGRRANMLGISEIITTSKHVQN